MENLEKVAEPGKKYKETCKQCGKHVNKYFYESKLGLKYCNSKCYNLFTED
jgi:hypothetical protein